MISVAIDGPAGAGKSTLARAAAAHFAFIYVDTGALYRTLGLKFILNRVSDEDDDAIAAVLSGTTVEIAFRDGEQRVLLDGTDVSDEIRTPEVSMAASAFSKKPAVRAFLLEMQRKIAQENNVVMDGRDIGTVVLPDATVKIFLTASAEVRAERRFKELLEKGEKVTFQEVYDDMVKRDYADSHREIAPLKPANDSCLVDTTGKTLAESLQLLINTITARIDRP